MSLKIRSVLGRANPLRSPGRETTYGILAERTLNNAQIAGITCRNLAGQESSGHQSGDGSVKLGIGNRVQTLAHAHALFMPTSQPSREDLSSFACSATSHPP